MRSCVSGRGGRAALFTLRSMLVASKIPMKSETAVRRRLLLIDHLIVADFADDDPRKLHWYWRSMRFKFPEENAFPLYSVFLQDRPIPLGQ